MKKVMMIVYNNFTRDARVIKEAKSLVELGYDVTVVAVLDKLTKNEEVKNGYKIIRIERFPLTYKLINFFKKIFGFKKTKENSNANVIVKGVGSKKLKNKLKNNLKQQRKKIYEIIRKKILFFHKAANYISFYIETYKKMKVEKFDIYHCHDLNTLLVGYILAKVKNNKKLIYDSHELYTETSNLGNIEKKIFFCLEKFLIHKVDEIITVCDSIAIELVNRYNIQKPKIIMNCPPKQKIEKRYNLIRELIEIPVNKEVILYQGGYSVNRGLENLIYSMKKVKKGVLVLMGFGKIEEDLILLAQKENLEKRVYFIPPVSQEELLFWSSSADIGIIPYQFVGLNNYYSCPNKLFEYINAGLPVCASNFPELKKIVLGHHIGETFNPNDSDDIARAINNMLENKEKLKISAKNSYEISNIYNWKEQAKNLKKIYEEI